MTGDHLEAFCRGMENGRTGRLTLEGFRHTGDEVARSLCKAGFDLARVQKGIGKFPIVIHIGRRHTFWLVDNDAETPGTVRPVFQATTPGERPTNRAGYHDLRALFLLKGEPLS